MAWAGKLVLTFTAPILPLWRSFVAPGRYSAVQGLTRSIFFVWRTTLFFKVLYPMPVK